MKIKAARGRKVVIVKPGRITKHGDRMPTTEAELRAMVTDEEMRIITAEAIPPPRKKPQGWWDPGVDSEFAWLDGRRQFTRGYLCGLLRGLQIRNGRSR